MKSPLLQAGSESSFLVVDLYKLSCMIEKIFYSLFLFFLCSFLCCFFLRCLLLCCLFLRCLFLRSFFLYCHESPPFLFFTYNFNLTKNRPFVNLFSTFFEKKLFFVLRIIFPGGKFGDFFWEDELFLLPSINVRDHRTLSVRLRRCGPRYCRSQ